MMEQKISEALDEQPIACALIILGILSFASAFVVVDVADGSYPVFGVTTIAGFICGFIALPLGLRLGSIELFPMRNPAYCPG